MNQQLHINNKETYKTMCSCWGRGLMCPLNITQPDLQSLNPAPSGTLVLRHVYYLLLTATIVDLCDSKW